MGFCQVKTVSGKQKVHFRDNMSRESYSGIELELGL